MAVPKRTVGLDAYGTAKRRRLLLFPIHCRRPKMNLFLNAHIARVIGNLTSAIEVLPPDVSKTAAWEGALQTLFRAYSYGQTTNNKKSTKSNGRFYEPPEISVQIKPSCPEPCELGTRQRRPYKVGISQDTITRRGESVTVIVRYSRQLADKSDWFEKVCGDFAKYADAKLGNEEIETLPPDP